MGEIKIKSGNLFDTSVYNNNAYLHNCTVTNTSNSVTITSTGTDPFVGLVNSPGTTVPERAQSMYIPVKPNTAYTIDMSSAPKCYCTQVDNSNVIKRGTQINLLPYRFTTDDSTTYVIIRLGDDTLQTGDSLTFESIQLLEGTYTSSTIPEYQPYFLNRPAHQLVNGQWVDIPTHHYTNGRWQGELTSQSPLKFRADGDMLDWRIEGKTSQNLFDIGITINDYERTYSIISVDGSSISMKYEASGMTYHYRTHNITTTGTVTIYCKGSKAKPQLLVRLRSMDDTKWLTNSDVTISGMAYNSVYNGWYSYAVSDTFIKTIIIPECLYWNMGVGFNSGGTAGEVVTISNPMVISGAYTSSTIPPYEPYGGVGDWDETEQKYKIPITVNDTTTNIFTDHQLMDGDSIDYATDQTAIPIAIGNNTLTVDTAVQPSKVFVKFEG